MATKPEQRMWDYLSNTMRGDWDAQRHEDELSTSIPDVSFARNGVDGWLELKTIAALPKRASTPITLKHLRSGQVNWLESRGRRGAGACWLLLAVGEEMSQADWYLVHHTRVRELYDGEFLAEDLRRLPRANSQSVRELLLDAIARVK